MKMHSWSCTSRSPAAPHCYSIMRELRATCSSASWKLSDNASIRLQDRLIWRSLQAQRAPCNWFRACISARATVAETDQEIDAEAQLRFFFQWLQANGVRGLAGRDDAIAPYVDPQSGERGVAAVQDIPEGQTVLEIPLRLAISDWEEDPDIEIFGLQDHANAVDSLSLDYHIAAACDAAPVLHLDAPWSVRLACKLLREQAKGPESQWAPYLQVLPTAVPQPAAGDLRLAEYSPLLAYQRLLRGEPLDWYGKVSVEAIGGASQEQYSWALSVLFSRTLGTAAPEGAAGIGVRMLLPMLDLCNHGGAEKAGTRLPHISGESVRWQLQPPGGGVKDGSGEWLMHVQTTTAVEAGSELLLDYGPHDNDNFLINYGFAVVGNPHDNMKLFPDIGSAVAWLLDRAGQHEASDSEFRDALRTAAAAAQEAERATLNSAEATPLGPELMIHAGGRVDVRLLAAFRALAAHQAQVFVALRCEELLASCTPLLQDVRSLAGDAEENDRQYFQLLLRDYSQDIKEMAQQGDFAPLGSGQARTALDWAEHITQLADLGGSGATPPLPASSARMGSDLLKYRVNKKVLLWQILLAASAVAHAAPP